jgi:hypothetical protein
MIKSASLSKFVRTVREILHSDRDVNMAIGGMTGEGKSTFTMEFMKEYYRQEGKRYKLDNITWDRKELMKWIDGEKDTKEGQLPEYSGIILDEAFLLFYRRTWYEEGQIDAIATLNMCRDRHLLLMANVPNFWSLDNHFQQRMRFYVFISQRGKAWIFRQDMNPFTDDAWNTKENKKMFAKHRNPYKCPNFFFELKYPDLSPKEKETYLALRNSKRVEAVTKHKGAKSARVRKVLGQRDILIKELVNVQGYSQINVAEMIEVDPAIINNVANGITDTPD